MLDQIDDIIQNNGGDVFHNNDTTAVYILVYADFRVANFASLLLRFCFTFASRLLHVCFTFASRLLHVCFTFAENMKQVYGISSRQNAPVISK